MSFLIANAEEIYVQSVKAKIKQEPNSSAADAFEVERGNTLEKIETQGLWIKIKFKNKTGWINKILTSPNKPVGQSDLLKLTDESVEKVTRKRTSNYSVSASTRGLVSSNRNRANAKKYRANFKSLEDLEDQGVSKQEVNDFMIKGNLAK